MKGRIITDNPQVLDGSLTIGEGTTWILTAAEVRELVAARRRSDQYAASWFLAIVLVTIALIGLMICSPLIAAVLL